ncbi:MAG: thiol peroxidase [Tissierellia bacterium]|nr:thiol peroxidase [Tissierellia bacterium]
MNITFANNPVHLLGDQLKVGDKAPDFTAAKNDLADYKLSEDLGKKVIIISVVPSIDTGVCSMQTQRFNKEASELDESIKLITISLDLPFAQGRFCGANGIDNHELVSDYKEREFGQKYGYLIDELKLLARGVVIIDKEGKIAYKEVVQEVTNEVDFDTALEEAKKLVK